MKKAKKQRRSNKKSGELKFSQIFLVLVFVAGITFLGLSVFMPKKETHEGETLSTVTNETEKKKETETPKNDGNDNPDKTPKQYEGDDETDKKSINASITKNDVQNGKYYLRVTIYEKLGDGTCKLHMETKQGDTIDRTANVIESGADSSTCEGFDIPTSGISAGSYDFTVTITAGEKSGVVKGIIKV